MNIKTILKNIVAGITAYVVAAALFTIPSYASHNSGSSGSSSTSATLSTSTVNISTGENGSWRWGFTT